MYIAIRSRAQGFDRARNPTFVRGYDMVNLRCLSGELVGSLA